MQWAQLPRDPAVLRFAQIKRRTPLCIWLIRTDKPAVVQVEETGSTNLVRDLMGCAVVPGCTAITCPQEFSLGNDPAILFCEQLHTGNLHRLPHGCILLLCLDLCRSVFLRLCHRH